MTVGIETALGSLVLSKVFALRQQMNSCQAGEAIHDIHEQGTSSSNSNLFTAGDQDASSDELLQEESEVLQMLESCDEIRLRILASLIYLPNGKQPPTLAEAAKRRIGAIVKLPGGLIYALVDNVYVILLPNISDETACDKVTDDLLELHDRCQGRVQHWLLDFSGIKHPLPVLFLGALYSFRMAMHKDGSLLAMTWLRDNLLPPKMAEALCKAFDLCRGGASFFSSQIAW